MAIQSFSVQDFAQAGELIEKVLKLNPDHAEARELKDRVDQIQKDAEVIVEIKFRAGKIDPLMQAGRELFDQKKYEEALSRFNEILKIDTQHEEAIRLRDLSKDLLAKDFYSAALRAARDGDMAGASVFAQKALKFKPDYSEASDLLNTAEQKRKVVDEVKSKELYKDSLDAFLAGDPQKAYELAVKALELDPNNEMADRMRSRLSQRGNGTQ